MLSKAKVYFNAVNWVSKPQYLILEATTVSCWCFSCLCLQLLALFFPLKALLKIFPSCSLSISLSLPPSLSPSLSLPLSLSHTHTQMVRTFLYKTFISSSLQYLNPICLSLIFCKCVQIYAQPPHGSFSLYIWFLSQNTARELAHASGNCPWL